MLIKAKFTVLFFMCMFLMGCATSQAVATSEERLLTPTSTLASATSTPVCVNEPVVKPDNLAALDLPDSLVEIESGVDRPSPWNSPQIKDGLTFYIRGMYAINKDIAFIFGGLKVPAGTIVSLLLRSTDGGIHWKEVLNPIDYNDITHVVFIGKGEGWAISTWTPEGDAGTRLWHTTDFGETWQENKGHPPTTISIRVFDSKHMQVQSLNWWANPNTDRYMIWDSYDGGTTWAESFSVPVNDTNVKSVFEAYADVPGGRYGNYFQCNVWENACTAYGQDGSKWQIESIYGKQCLNGYAFDKLLYAKVHHIWQGYESKIAIPVYFSYDANKIQVKP